MSEILHAIATLERLRADLIFGEDVEKLPGLEGTLLSESRVLLWQATSVMQQAEMLLRQSVLVAERERNQKL